MRPSRNLNRCFITCYCWHYSTVTVRPRPSATAQQVDMECRKDDRESLDKNGKDAEISLKASLESQARRCNPVGLSPQHSSQRDLYNIPTNQPTHLPPLGCRCTPWSLPELPQIPQIPQIPQFHSSRKTAEPSYPLTVRRLTSINFLMVDWSTSPGYVGTRTTFPWSVEHVSRSGMLHLLQDAVVAKWSGESLQQRKCINEEVHHPRF